jgi:hypothetical protein
MGKTFMHLVAFFYFKSVGRKVLGADSAQKSSRRVKPQSLVDDHVQVGQVLWRKKKN